MDEHKAAVRLVGLRHAKKGSTISEAWEIIGRKFLADACTNIDQLVAFPKGYQAHLHQR
jgi:hypothetical protein